MSLRPPPIISDVTEPIKDSKLTRTIVSDIWGKWFHHIRTTFNNFISGLDSGSLLVATDADGNLTDVDDLTDWIVGSNGITITDDGDGTLTIGQNTPSQGNLYCYAAASNLNTVAINTWYQIVSFTTQGNLTANVTVSVAESHIEIGSSGTQYFLTWFSGAISCAAAHSFEVMIKKNNGVTAVTSIVAEFSTPAATPYNISAQNVVAFNADDTVELWIKRTTAGDNITVTIDNMTMGVLETANY